MARATTTQSLNPSVLDRLLDDNPGVQRDPPTSSAQALRELHWAVRRDLEDLLNTRRRCLEYPPELSELEKSLVNYGIPDLAGANLSADESREQFRRIVESVIRAYEPRFKNVRVTLLENAEPLDRTLRFRIDAVVYAEPAPERVVFDSLLEPLTRSVEIKEVDNE